VQARAAPGRGHHRNNEKELPDAFLRRCFFHYIRFPDRETMRRSSTSLPQRRGRLVREALEVFFGLRDMPGLRKRPSTSELLDWLKLLMAEDIGPEILRERQAKKAIPPMFGRSLKNEQDTHSSSASPSSPAAAPDRRLRRSQARGHAW
jgi:MoxR-like ATPase